MESCVSQSWEMVRMLQGSRLVCPCVWGFVLTLFSQSGQLQGPWGSAPRAASHTTTAACSSQGFQGHLVWMGLKCGKGKGRKRKKNTIKNRNLFLGNRKDFDWTGADEIWRSQMGKVFCLFSCIRPEPPRHLATGHRQAVTCSCSSEGQLPHLLQLHPSSVWPVTWTWSPWPLTWSRQPITEYQHFLKEPSSKTKK